ncbi:AAA family ATPase [Teichococcus aestuarii]|nr:AAA family ATPase [Pseudoroseomonas aestuarii]
MLANQKGGVSKAPYAINLTCGLARQEARLLLVDLDPQAKAALMTLGSI